MKATRVLVPVVLLLYAVIALSCMGTSKALVEIYPISAMNMFFMVPDRPPVQQQLDELRRTD